MCTLANGAVPISLTFNTGRCVVSNTSPIKCSPLRTSAKMSSVAPYTRRFLEAFQKRRVYGATDDILADVRSGEHLMGEVFDTTQRPVLNVKLIGTAPFAKVHIIKDNKYVYTVEPKTQTVSFTW